VLPYEAKAVKNQDYAATPTSANSPTKAPAENTPTIKVEAYGKITGSNRHEAKAFYEGTLKSLSADQKKSYSSCSRSYQTYAISDKAAIE